MKNVRNLIFKVLAVVVILLPTTHCAQEVEFDTRGIVFLQVFSNLSGDPAPNATVEVYSSDDDWTFEINKIMSVKTNENGEVTIDKLATGQYYFDIRQGAQNNWQTMDSFTSANGEISFAFVSISENINLTIAGVNGKSWKVAAISNSNGQDLSNDPDYSCYLDNVDLFEKAGFYGRNNGNNYCNVDEPELVEGSWWSNSLESLYLLLNDTVFEYAISDFTGNSFSARPVNIGDDVIFHYELVQ